MNRKTCAYCGKPANSRDHVFPRCLYASSTNGSKVQHLTVPACIQCNNKFSDDEVQFRNVLSVMGQPTPEVEKLWVDKVARSFHECDGSRRVRDLLASMKTVKTEDGERQAIYPGDCDRVMRVVRKIIRGLCSYHQIMSPVTDQRVKADVLRYLVPLELIHQMEYHDLDPNIVQYRFKVLGDPNYLYIHSVWLLTFLGNRNFLGIVSTSGNGFSESDWT